MKVHLRVWSLHGALGVVQGGGLCVPGLGGLWNLASPRGSGVSHVQEVEEDFGVSLGLGQGAVGDPSRLKQAFLGSLGVSGEQPQAGAMVTACAGLVFPGACKEV